MRRTILEFDLDRLYRKPIKFTSAGVATEYINDETVKPGYIFMLTRIVVENETTSYTSFRIGVYDGTNYHLEEEQKTPVAGQLYWTTEPIYIAEGENLRVELVGCTSGDIVKVYVDGFFRKLTEGW